MDFILSLIALEVIGAFFLLVVIRRERYKYSATEFFSLSFLLGAAFASFQLFLYYMAGISFDFINVSMLPIVSLILILARYVSKPERGRDFLPIEPVRFKLSIFEKWLLAGIVLQFLWTIFLTLPIPVHSHDAVANYALKAKIFYTYNGIPEGFFRLSESTVAHTDYPLLLPLLMRWVYAFTGQNDLVVNMIMPMIYLAFMGLFYALAKKILNRTCALVAVFFLATVPQVVDYATIIHADLVLTAFIACSIAYFVRYIRTGNRRQLDLASIF
ncbi:MAG: glycosyltransferase family 39 protein, partial [Candidatus Omnitrophica bacterium]|nr:glycosyltransferase family 39 protein [Candidatus Omnitrophota bacterium]